MRTRHGIAVGIAATLLYLGFLVATIPAGWIKVGVERASLPVDIAAARGTIWSGSARTVLHLRRGSTIDLGIVHWKLNPLYLVAGKAGLGFSARRGDFDAAGDAVISLRSIRFHHVDASIPLTALHPVYPPAAISGIKGVARVSLEDFLLDQKKFTAAGEIRLDQLTSTMIGPDPVGSYAITLSSKNDVLLFDVRTKEGGLMVSGHGSWEPMASGTAQFDGTVKTRLAGLAAMLPRLGKPAADGATRIQWSGRLASPAFR